MTPFARFALFTGAVLVTWLGTFAFEHRSTLVARLVWSFANAFVLVCALYVSLDRERRLLPHWSVCAIGLAVAVLAIWAL